MMAPGTTALTLLHVPIQCPCLSHAVSQRAQASERFQFLSACIDISNVSHVEQFHNIMWLSHPLSDLLASPLIVLHCATNICKTM